VEGRARGKIDFGGETLTGETKPEKSTETKLTKIAQKSKENPRGEFNWLMPHFNRESLKECFNEIEGNKALGADGQTKEEYGRDLEKNIDELIEKMKTMSYRPGPVREVLIPKEGKKGKYRALGISNYEDKIVQLMMSKILNAMYEPIFQECSYGFRPGRSCHKAVKAVRQYLFLNDCEIVIDIDLKNFFGTINHEILVKILRMRIKDEKFIRYIIRMLKAGVLRNGELIMTEEGSPQGSIVSPILSNIYAHYIIDNWIEKVIKKAVRGKIELFRYCDDMVICCQYRQDAEAIKRALAKRLARYSLELNEEKTKLVTFSQREQSAGKKQGSFDFLGFTFYLGRSRKGNVTPKVKTSKVRMRSKLKKAKEWIRKYRSSKKMKPLWEKYVVKLSGHIRYYGVSFNTYSVDLFLFQARKLFFKWMNRRSQRKSMDWPQFTAFVTKHPLPAVKIYFSLW
jgi:RNA-directed DNA polymerase